jgi:hypothetical protein
VLAGTILATVLALVLLVLFCCLCRRKQSSTPDEGHQVTQDTRCFWALISIYCTVAAALVVALVVEQSVLKQAREVTQLELWDVVCILVTLATLLCVPRIVRGFKQRLDQVVDASRRSALTVQEDATGWGGAFMFLWGLLDLFLDVGQSVSLASCGHWWLFVCSTATFLVTTVVCVHLGAHMLSAVAKDSDQARSWVADHGKLSTFVVLASSSRLESVAILRLRLCDRDIIKLPIQPAYFHFIRHAGMFHFLLEDFPHALVGIAQLSKAGQDTCGQASAFEMPVDAKMVTKLNVIFSLGSIVFGVVLRWMQMLVLRTTQDNGGESLSFRASLLFGDASRNEQTNSNSARAEAVARSKRGASARVSW